MGSEQSSALDNSIPSKRLRTVKTFNPEKYSGRWFELARYDTLIYEQFCFIAIADYSWNSQTQILQVINTCLDKNENSLRQSNGQATIVDNKDPGKLSISFEDSGTGENCGSYWVHWTDYDNYSIVGSPSGKYLWILSRYEKSPGKDLPFLLKKVQQFGYDDYQLTSRRSFIDYGKDKNPA